jgi:hypothetical protein
MQYDVMSGLLRGALSMVRRVDHLTYLYQMMIIECEQHV